MRIPVSIVKEFKRMSFALAKDEELFTRLKNMNRYDFWTSLQSIQNERGIYRTMESEHISFLLDRLDDFLEENIQIIKQYECGTGAVTEAAKSTAIEALLQILKMLVKLLKKDQYKYLFRSLDRVFEIFEWVDSLIVKRHTMHLLLVVLLFKDSTPRQELQYLKQYQIDQMSYFIRFSILHMNSYNSGYSELSDLFRPDNLRYYKLDILHTPKNKKQIPLNEVNGSEDFRTKETINEEELAKQYRENEMDNWVNLQQKMRHFEFFESSLDTRSAVNLSTRPVFQKLTNQTLVEIELDYDHSLSLHMNSLKQLEKITSQGSGGVAQDANLLIGIKDRLLLLREYRCLESRVEIAKIFLLSIQVLSFIMKVSRKSMQAIITDQQLAFEKFQKSFPKQVTDLIQLELEPKLHSDVIRFMLVIIKEESQLRKVTEEFLSKQSDSVIYKIYTDCSNLDLQVIESPDKPTEYKVCVKSQLVQPATLLNSKFIDYALKFVNIILKYPENNSGIQEVTPFAMNFVRTPFASSEYLTYNIGQLKKAIISLSLMVQHDEVQREHKILSKVLEKIEYYLEQRPRYQWVQSEWQPITQRQYDVFLSHLLRILNLIFETNHKRLRRIAPQLAKQIIECHKFFFHLGTCIDRIAKGYDIVEEVSAKDCNPTVVHPETELSLIIETAHLLSNINKENPNFIEKLIEDKIIAKTVSALQVISLPHDTKSLSHIINFLYHVSLKEQGRKIIMESKLLMIVLDVLVDDAYSEELYAYTLQSLIDAIANYYNNIKEIVPLIYEKLNEILIILLKKCQKFTNSVEKYLSSNQTVEMPDFKYKDVLCYQIINVCKILEKVITGLDQQYAASKNSFAGESLQNYLEILQFPFLFLMPQRTTHKTPFFAVKMTCKSFYTRLQPSETQMMTKLLERNIITIEELLGCPIDKLSTLPLDLVTELTAKDAVSTLSDPSQANGFYRQIKLYQQLQFLDAMINTFRSLRLTCLTPDYSTFVKKVSTLFPITFHQRFLEQIASVKLKLEEFNQSHATIFKSYQLGQETLKSDELNLENEFKEFRQYFKDNILSFKNHVNHYSYQNIIFYTILKLVYQNQQANEELGINSPNSFDVYRLINLIISNIEVDSIDIKTLEKYDFKSLEVFSSVAGQLVMVTQIMQIFMKESKPINYFIIKQLQRDGSLKRICEVAKKFADLWQQSELKSCQKSTKDEEVLQSISKESKVFLRRFQNILSSCIDLCLESINSKLEYFFKMVSLQIQVTLNFKRDHDEEYRESIRRGVYGWHYEQIEQQQMVLKSLKQPSKNKYFSQLIEFLITHIEFQLLPRYQQTKKFIEVEKQIEKQETSPDVEALFQKIKPIIPELERNLLTLAISECRQFAPHQPLEQALPNFIMDNMKSLMDKMKLQGKIGETTKVATIQDRKSDQQQQSSSSISMDMYIPLEMTREKFYDSVKANANAMCEYLFRELFCFKNHSDQILALLLRQEQVDLDSIHQDILKIAELKAARQVNPTASKPKEASEATASQASGTQHASTSLSRRRYSRPPHSLLQGRPSSQRSSSQSSVIPTTTEATASSMMEVESAPAVAPQLEQPQQPTLQQPPELPLQLRQQPSINFQRNNRHYQFHIDDLGTSTQRISSIFSGEQDESRNILEQFLSTLTDNRSRRRQEVLHQHLMQQQQEKTAAHAAKPEKDQAFLVQIQSWNEDELLLRFSSIKKRREETAYILFATLSYLASKIEKSAAFKNPFNASRETIQKLRSNELLRLPSKLDAASAFTKLSLINTLLPFAVKFGFFASLKKGSEVSTAVAATNDSQKEQTRPQTPAPGSSRQTKEKESAAAPVTATSVHVNQPTEQKSEAIPNSILDKIETIPVEELEFKWKDEDDHVYIVAERLLSMSLAILGQNRVSKLFPSNKNDEKEISVKQNHFEITNGLVDNICHIIQKVNKNSQKFKEKIAKTLQEAEKERDQQVNKAAIFNPSKLKLFVHLYTFKQSQQQADHKMVIEKKPTDNSADVADESSSSKPSNQSKANNKKKSQARFSSQSLSQDDRGKKAMQKEAQPQKDRSDSAGKTPKQSAKKQTSSQSSIKAKIVESQRQIETIKQYETRVIEVLVSLLRVCADQHKYFERNLFSVNTLTFILDSFKELLEGNRSLLETFIKLRGVEELLRIRFPTDVVVEKLNGIMSILLANETMARANYESKIKYFFYEKCLSKLRSKQKDQLSKSESGQAAAGSGTSVKQQSAQQQSTPATTAPPSSSTQTPSPLKKQKRLRVLYADVKTRFAAFKNVPLFQEIFTSLCVARTYIIKQKAGSGGASTSKPTASKTKTTRGKKNASEVTEASGTEPSANQSRLNQMMEAFDIIRTRDRGEQNEDVQPAKRATRKRAAKASNSQGKAKTSKGKPQRKIYYELRDNVQLHKLQFLNNDECFLHREAESREAAPEEMSPKKQKQQSQSQQNANESKKKSVDNNHNKRSASRSHVNHTSDKAAVGLSQPLQKDKSASDNKTPKQAAESNYNAMINFTAPNLIYSTLNAILEQTVKLITKRIMKGYDALQNGKYDEIDEDKYLFNPMTLVKVLQLIARQHPVLVPQIVRFRCSKIVKKLIAGHPMEQTLQKQLGTHFHFLKFITKCANYFTTAALKGLIFELCLDKTILYESTQKSNNNTIVSIIKPFGGEIRKKVLGELYSSIEQELTTKEGEKGLFDRPESVHLIISNVLLHLYLLNIREAAKLSLKKSATTTDGDQNDSEGFQFAKLYSETLQLIDIAQMNQLRSIAILVTSMLESLYILNYFFVLFPSGISSHKQNRRRNGKHDYDFVTQKIQEQILPEQLQKYIKQYTAGTHFSHGANQESHFQTEQFGQSSRVPFRFNEGLFGSSSAWGQASRRSLVGEQGQNPVPTFNILVNSFERDRAARGVNEGGSAFGAGPGVSGLSFTAPQRIRQANGDDGREDAFDRLLFRSNRMQERLSFGGIHLNSGGASADQGASNQLSQDHAVHTEEEEEEEEEEEDDDEDNMNHLFSADDEDEEDDDDEDDEDDEEDDDDDEDEEEDDEDEDVDIDEEEEEEEERESDPQEEEEEEDLELELDNDEDGDDDDYEDVDDDDEDGDEHPNRVARVPRVDDDSERNSEDADILEVEAPNFSTFGMRQIQNFILRQVGSSEADSSGRVRATTRRRCERNANTSSRNAQQEESLEGNRQEQQEEDEYTDVDDEEENEIQEITIAEQARRMRNDMASQGLDILFNFLPQQDGIDGREIIIEANISDNDDEGEGDENANEDAHDGIDHNADWEVYSSQDEAEQSDADEDSNSFSEEEEDNSEVDVRDRVNSDGEDSIHDDEAINSRLAESEDGDDEEEEEMSDEESDVWGDYNFSNLDVSQDEHSVAQLDEDLDEEFADIEEEEANHEEDDGDDEDDLEEEEEIEDEDRIEEVNAILQEIDSEDFNEDKPYASQASNMRKSKHGNAAGTSSKPSQNERLNVDFDCKDKLQNVREITELKNITMCSCLRETMKVCQAQVSHFYIASSLTSVHMNVIKEVLRELSVAKVSQQADHETKSVLISLFIYLKHMHQEGMIQQVNARGFGGLGNSLVSGIHGIGGDSGLTRPGIGGIGGVGIAAAGATAAGAGANSLIAGEISNSQMQISQYQWTAHERRAGNSAAGASGAEVGNGPLSGAPGEFSSWAMQQYRMRFHSMPMSQQWLPLFSRTNNLPQMQRQQIEQSGGEQDIQGSSLNDLISHLQTQNTPRISTAFNNLSHLIRGNHTFITNFRNTLGNITQRNRPISLPQFPRLSQPFFPSQATNHSIANGENGLSPLAIIRPDESNADANASIQAEEFIQLQPASHQETAVNNTPVQLEHQQQESSMMQAEEEITTAAVQRQAGAQSIVPSQLIPQSNTNESSIQRSTQIQLSELANSLAMQLSSTIGSLIPALQNINQALQAQVQSTEPQNIVQSAPVTSNNVQLNSNRMEAEPTTQATVTQGTQAPAQMQVEPRRNSSIQSQLTPESMVVLSRMNLDGSFLERHGLDVQIFNELPDDIKEELIFSYLSVTNDEPQNNSNQSSSQPVQGIAGQMSEASSSASGAATATATTGQARTDAIMDPSASTGSQPANPASQIRQANVDFVNCSDANLRRDILIQSGEEFLSTLTPAMQEEARALRQQQEALRHNRVEQEAIVDQLQYIRNAQNEFNNRSQQLPMPADFLNWQALDHEMMFTEIKNPKKPAKLIDDLIESDDSTRKKLIETDDKLIESVLKLIYYGRKQQSFFPLQLLELICKNPSVEEKVFDSLMFILLNRNMDELLQKQSRNKQIQQNAIMEVEGKPQPAKIVSNFPLAATYYRNSKELDYSKVYIEITLKILKIIQKLTLKRVLYFVKLDILENPAENEKSVQNTISSLESVKELRQISGESEKAFGFPFFQFVFLLTQEPFRNNFEHLKYLLSSIQNVTKTLFMHHRSTGKSCLLLLGQKSTEQHAELIVWICSIFSSDCLNDLLIRKLSIIINQLCYDAYNLEMFVKELRNIIKFFCLRINNAIVACLGQIKALDRKSPSFSSKFKQLLTDLETQVQGEKKIQNIFQIIYELFEKSFMSMTETKELVSKANANLMEEEIPASNAEQTTATTTTTGTATAAAAANTNQETTVASITAGTNQPRTRSRKLSEQRELAAKQKELAEKRNAEQQKENERMEKVKSEIRKKFEEILSHESFTQLWVNCAELFSVLGNTEPHNLASFNGLIHKLQPVIESYFIIFRIMHDNDFEFLKKAHATQHSNMQQQAQSNRTNQPMRISSLAEDDDTIITELGTQLSFESLLQEVQSLDKQKVFQFICEQCKGVVNQMIRSNLKQKKSSTNPQQSLAGSYTNRRSNDVLQKDPFEIIFKRFPTLVEFENKKNYFKTEMIQLKASIAPTLNRRRRIKIRREHIFEDSFSQIEQMKPEELKQKFIIEFDGEEGIDAGGLIREWFVVLSKAIFNPDYLLFKPSSTGNTYQPNKSSYLNDPHLQYFKFVGRVVGKALFEGQLLDAYFTRSFYKHILGQPLTYHDIEDQDYEFYKSLKWIMEHDITSLTDITFSYEENEFDSMETVELKPNGRNIAVTEENKQEYVKLICYEKMAKNIKAQIEHFLEGFHELIPANLVRIFDSHELELMISGLPDIDVMDLRDNTEYHSYSSNSKMIIWFWEILDEFDSTQKASFIQFVTGTSKVPVEGFKGLRGISGLQKFSIHKAFDARKLPVAHTCFNQLDLPEYPTKDTLKKKLMLAISEGKEGFGFA